MEQQTSELEDHWWAFTADISDVPVPGRFPYPFYYQAQPLSQLAAEQLQDYLASQTTWADLHQSEIGKMFGVLVVRSAEGQMGFLAAFSGKIGDRSTIPPFVPPFFDRHDPDGFFRVGEEELNQMNAQIESLETDPDFRQAQESVEQLQKQSAEEIEYLQEENRQAKKRRKARRQAAEQLDALAQNQLEEELNQQSIQRHFLLKDLKRKWRERLQKAAQELEQWQAPLRELKEKRKRKSAELQQQLFDRYQFLNLRGERKKVTEIFADTAFRVPPAGAGDCAAPKLLQFAFEHQLEPLAMAEFWWGPAPKSAIRKHGHYYPACRGKCEPILSHMLAGMEVAPNPLAEDRVQVDELEIVYEDEYLALINKPAGFLAVPGKSWTDSVFTRMRQRYPEATGPLVVHRLDMSTSGLMLVAKDKDTHKQLQQQFIKRSISKRYVAVLDGEVDQEEGVIDLPLRVDLEDRPRQLVCYEHGKAARTLYKVVKRAAGQTRIHFFPVTGRTHQLRVHAAHPKGLGMPIVGDDLYGTSADRLLLHAAEISFVHPASGAVLRFQCAPAF